MIAQSVDNKIKRHVAFPYSDDGISALSQVAILGAISFLLCYLPIGQWLKSRMSMPVIAVSLDDDIIDSNIDNEFIFNNCRWLKRDFQVVKDTAQFPFKLARFCALYSLTAFYSRLIHLFNFIRVVFSPLAYLLGNLGPFHWIIFNHSLALRATFFHAQWRAGLILQPLSKLQSQSGRAHAYRDLGDIQSFRYSPHSLSRVVLFQVGDVGISPVMLRGIAISAMAAMLPILLGMPRIALWAVVLWGGTHTFLCVSRITALGRAKTPLRTHTRRLLHILFVWRIAGFTKPLRWCRCVYHTYIITYVLKSRQDERGAMQPYAPVVMEDAA